MRVLRRCCRPAARCEKTIGVPELRGARASSETVAVTQEEPLLRDALSTAVGRPQQDDVPDGRRG